MNWIAAICWNSWQYFNTYSLLFLNIKKHRGKCFKYFGNWDLSSFKFLILVICMDVMCTTGSYCLLSVAYLVEEAFSHSPPSSRENIYFWTVNFREIRPCPPPPSKPKYIQSACILVITPWRISKYATVSYAINFKPKLNQFLTKKEDHIARGLWWHDGYTRVSMGFTSAHLIGIFKMQCLGDFEKYKFRINTKCPFLHDYCCVLPFKS